MDFDEHEEQEEEEMEEEAPLIPTANYDSGRPKIGLSPGGEAAAGASSAAAATNSRKPVRYRECLKNHAVNIGGHALDGCGEFMAAGEDGSLDALKCAACNCHRNFHRKETDGTGTYHHHQQQQHPQISPYYPRAPAPPAGYLHMTGHQHQQQQQQQQHRPLALPAASGGGYSREDEDVSNPSRSGGGGGGGGMSGGGSKKRHRTKFTQEQKDKMLDLAEKLGWRIQKHDELVVEQFCVETGVKRHVLKVWMHNKKHTIGKKP